MANDRTVPHPTPQKVLGALIALLLLNGTAAAADAPAADASGRFTTLDMRPVVNMDWRDQKANDGKGGWTDQGDNDMRNVQPGMTTLLGVPFDLIDPAKNGGKAVLTLKSHKFNAGVAQAEIPVNATAGSIYFLHASAWSSGRMATYSVVYDDGVAVDLPVVAGETITDWWAPVSKASYRVALQVPNAQTDDVGMVVYGWTNPLPAKKIVKLVITTADADGIVVLAAVTISDAPLSLPEIKEVPTPAYLQSDRDTLDDSQWFAIEQKKDAFQPTCIDQLPHLDAPAGKHGFQKTVGGKWVFDDGTPCHLVGSMANPPETHQLAIYQARWLAKYGFSEIRIGHLIDNGLIDAKRPDTQHFNAAYLDRLDFWINELAKNGIYSRLTTIWYRKFKAGDGLKDYDAYVAYERKAGRIKAADKEPLLNSCGLTFYVPDIMKLNIDLEIALMTHKNPYRNDVMYGQDPAICQYEVTNEDGAFFYTIDHPAPVFDALKHQLWREWLAKRYGGDDGLTKAWGEELGGSESLAGGNIGLYMMSSIVGASAQSRPRRLADQVRFYADLANGYFIKTRDALRAAGMKQPLCGSGWYGAGPTFDADIWANAQGLDYIDRHQYWAGGPGDWQMLQGLTFNTDCALKQPELMLKLGGERVVGKPFSISEWANVLPNQFRVEAPGLMAIYGNELGGWDMPMHFAMGDAGGFSTFLKWMWPVDEPSTLCQYNALSQMIRRGDIKEGPDAYVRSLSDAKVLSGKPMPDALVRLDISGPFEKLASAQGLNARTLAATYAGAVGRTGMDVTGAVEKPDTTLDLNTYIATQRKEIHSATGELYWNYGHGYVTASAPRMQAAIGFTKDLPIALADCDLTVSNMISSVIVVPLDDEPIATSKHLLITAVGRCRNSGMYYNQCGMRLLTLGASPIKLEGVKGTLTLHRSGTCTVSGLDPYGYKACDVTTQAAGATTVIPLDGKNKSAYYEVQF